MHTKVFELKVDAPPERVWEFHNSEDALKKLSPPGMRVKPVKGAKLEDGALQVFRFWRLGLPMTWKARISQVTPPYGFTDQAEKSPFKFWRHRHDFIPDGDGTLIREVVAYILPFGKLGKALNKLIVSKSLDESFAHRQKVMENEFGKRE